MINRKTLIWAYWNGEINMRKSAGVWMVDVASVNKHFYEPIHPFDLGQD